MRAQGGSRLIKVCTRLIIAKRAMRMLRLDMVSTRLSATYLFNSPSLLLVVWFCPQRTHPMH